MQQKAFAKESAAMAGARALLPDCMLPMHGDMWLPDLLIVLSSLWCWMCVPRMGLSGKAPLV